MAETATTNPLDPAVLASVSSVDLRARLVVDGLMQGLHRSPLQGVSVEFAQHRPYVAGDDTRFLDWKVYGRTDKLYLKQYQRETNLDLFILVDVSGSMAYRGETSPWQKFDAAATLAAAMSKLALDQRDRAAVWLFDDHVLSQSRLSNATGHLAEVAEVLSRADVKEVAASASGMSPDAENLPGRTDLAKVFERVNARLHHRAIIVLISDLFDDPDVIESGLARLGNARHDVIVLQVLDPAELEFPFRSASEFIGMEAEGRLPLDPAALREAYLNSLNEHLRRVEQTTRRFGFDYLRVESHRPLGPALTHFLARRAAAIAKSA